MPKSEFLRRGSVHLRTDEKLHRPENFIKVVINFLHNGDDSFDTMDPKSLG